MATNPYIQVNPVAWHTIANEVVQLTEQTETDPATYRITVAPIDTNDVGAGEKDVAYYFKDYIGTTGKIIAYDSTTIDVEDSFRRGFCPVVGKTAVIYKSIEEDSPYLAPIFYRFLSQQALEYSRQIEEAVLWSLVHRSAGSCQISSVTDNGDGSITLGTGKYCLFNNAAGSGIITQYEIEGGVISLTDLTTNYIIANYNSGSPIIEVITDVSLINETTIVPVYTVFRNGIYLHTQNWDSLASALSNKIHQSIVKTQRYRREYGLSLSEYGTRNLALTAGRVWTGAVPLTLDAIASATDNIFLWHHSSGVWTPSIVTQYNNTQYDNGTDLVELTANRYAVNWVFRGVETQKHLYVILGTGDYTLAQAEIASVPEIPIAISSHAVLVGKVVIQKSDTTALSILSAFEKSFSFSSVSSHPDLLNLNWEDSGHTGTANKIAGFGASGEAVYLDEGEPVITAGTTAQYWRGDKTWQSLLTAIHGTVLTGLSTASAVAITATDTMLQAFGKLQALINNLLNDDIAFEFADVIAGTAKDYTLDIKASYGYTIESACLETDTGTLTGVAVKIGSTAVTGLSSITVDSSVDETSATAAKTVVAGNRVTLSISTGYSGAPTLIRGKLKIKRT